MPQVVGALAVTFFSWGASATLATFLAQATVRLLASVALGAIASNLVKNSRSNTLPSGIRTPSTAAGGNNPVSFVIGTYATAGYAVCPPMSHGTVGKVQNAYMTYVIEIGDIRRMNTSRVIIDGEYVTLTGSVDADGFYGVTGRFLDHARVKFYDGTQTVADPWLLTTYGSYPERPWTSDMIGRDQCYAIVVLKTNNEIWNGLPQVRFESTGIPLYDPRLDTTVGGSGSQRWATPSTWLPSNNPLVQAYNIFRGISFADGTVWGGQVDADDLPLSDWFDAMDACDVATALAAGGTEPAYRSGFEVKGTDEPMAILEEIQKAASCRFVDVGGVWKPRVGPVGLPVLFITDDDVLVSKDQSLNPFPNLSETYNGVSATYPEPASLYEPVSAPVRLSATDETADGGRRLVADLSFAAVTSKDQVQRLMEAYRLDNRRFGDHHLTLGPTALLLEPGDAISWTSTANNYTAEVFEVESVSDDLMSCAQLVTIRKRDAADYNWNAATDTKASFQPSAKFVVPAAQSVPSFAVAPVLVTGDVAGVQTPGIEISWDPTDLGNATAIRYRVRRASDSVVISYGSTVDLEAGELAITNGILGDTDYEVRARLIIPNVTTSWTAWTAVTTGTEVTAPVGTPGLTDDSVTNAKLANMAQATFKMRAAGAGTGDPIDGTAAQAKTALAITQADVAGLTSDLALKAPLASPTFTGVVSLPDGAVGAPGAAFSSDPDTGMWRAGANLLAFSVAGSEALRLSSSKTKVESPVYIGTDTDVSGVGAAGFQVQGVGTASSATIARFSNNVTGPTLNFAKSRATAINTYTILNAADHFGNLDFYGADGSTEILGARIQAYGIGTPASGDMRAGFKFYTGSGAGAVTSRLNINDTTVTANIPLVGPSYTVAGLPAAGTAGAGATAFVTNGSVAHAGNSGNIVAGGGANFVPVYSDGTNWRIM